VPTTPNEFYVIHNDGLIHVRIEPNLTTITVKMIKDVGVIIRAINQAVDAGATRTTLLTGEVVNPNLARKYIVRAETGTTWRNGNVTRLADGEDGPTFRIDWDVLPRVTE
jgi:hypothetical protein